MGEGEVGSVHVEVKKKIISVLFPAVCSERSVKPFMIECIIKRKTSVVRLLKFKIFALISTLALYKNADDKFIISTCPPVYNVQRSETTET